MVFVRYWSQYWFERTAITSRCVISNRTFCCLNTKLERLLHRILGNPNHNILYSDRIKTPILLLFAEIEINVLGIGLKEETRSLMQWIFSLKYCLYSINMAIVCFDSGHDCCFARETREVRESKGERDCRKERPKRGRGRRSRHKRLNMKLLELVIRHREWSKFPGGTLVQLEYFDRKFHFSIVKP